MIRPRSTMGLALKRSTANGFAHDDSMSGRKSSKRSNYRPHVENPILSPKSGWRRIGDLHVSQCQGKSTSFLGTLGRARIARLIGCSCKCSRSARRAAPETERSLAERSGGAGAARADHLHLQVSATFLDQNSPHAVVASRLVVPASRQDRTSICCLRLRGVRTED